jgi:hypothetical protein
MIYLIGNSSKLVYNIAPIEEAGSPGVPISYTTFGINYLKYSYLVPTAIIFVILGGLLGIAGGLLSPKSVLYEVSAGVVVLAGIAMFVSLLVYTAGFQLLAGTSNVFGTTASWSLGPGLFIALVSAIILVFGRMMKK